MSINNVSNSFKYLDVPLILDEPNEPSEIQDLSIHDINQLHIHLNSFGLVERILTEWSRTDATEKARLLVQIPTQFAFVLLKDMAADLLIGQQSPLSRNTLDLAKALFPKTSPDFVHNPELSARLTIEEKRKCIIEKGLSYQDALDFLVRYKNFQAGNLKRRALQDCLEYLLPLPVIAEKEFKYNFNYEDGADRDGIFWEHPQYDQFGCSSDTIKTYLENI